MGFRVSIKVITGTATTRWSVVTAQPRVASSRVRQMACCLGIFDDKRPTQAEISQTQRGQYYQSFYAYTQTFQISMADAPSSVRVSCVYCC